MITNTENLKSTYDRGFSQFQSYARGDFASQLLQEKKSSWENFQQAGLPTSKLESWKYTDISRISTLNFGPTPSVEITDVENDKSLMPPFSLDCYRTVFLNGVFIPGLSTDLSSLEGVSLESISQLSMGMGADLSGLNKDLSGFYRTKHLETALDDLNISLSEDGFILVVDDNIKLPKPLQIINLQSGNSEEYWTNSPRSLIFLGKNAEAEVLESFWGSQSQMSKYFTTSHSTFILGENSQLNYARHIRESTDGIHYGSCQFMLSQNSRLHSLNVTTGGQMVRNDIHVELQGEGSETHLNGLYITQGNQHVDNHTFIHHRKPHCLSRQLYKGVMDDESKAVFNGKIQIDKLAQKTDSSQLNQNLLLSKKAEVNSKPELEVNADDVKANHGSASGPLDPTELFYFQSRGINSEIATEMIAEGFLLDALYKYPGKKVRDHLISIMDDQRKGN